IGKIDKMVEEIREDVVMYLFSSIYFNSKWENPFSGGKTREKEFYLDDETIVNTDFMHTDEEMLNIDNNDEQGILLPYKNKKYGFLALMPKEKTNIKDYIEGLTGDSFNHKIKNMSK